MLGANMYVAAPVCLFVSLFFLAVALLMVYLRVKDAVGVRQELIWVSLTLIVLMSPYVLLLYCMVRRTADGRRC
jgi:hypothetical protein